MRSAPGNDHNRGAKPERAKCPHRIQMKQKSDDGGRNAQRAGKQHDRRERAAVDGGAFHQRADGLQIFFGPIRFHGIYFALQSHG